MDNPTCRVNLEIIESFLPSDRCITSGFAFYWCTFLAQSIEAQILYPQQYFAYSTACSEALSMVATGLVRCRLSAKHGLYNFYSIQPRISVGEHQLKRCGCSNHPQGMVLLNTLPSLIFNLCREQAQEGRGGRNATETFLRRSMSSMSVN